MFTSRPDRNLDLLIDVWKSSGYKGTIEAVTGFGKTFVAVLIIQDMNKARPDDTTLVIVPTRYLLDQWKDEIKKHDLKNVSVMVINTGVKSMRQTDLLILDEIHNYASDVFKGIFSLTHYHYILGLTATLERSDKKHYIIENECPVVDTISMKESLAMGYVSNFKVFNLGLVTYSNQAKTSLLKVPQKIIKKYGAVSVQCCLAMVNNLRKISKSKVCVSITGIAGPKGGSKQKPVGLVYIGIRVGKKVVVNKCNFKNKGRIFIQKQTVKKTLNLLVLSIKRDS